MQGMSPMSGYEFSDDQNLAILALAKRMRAVSVLMGLTGVLAIANAVPGLLSGDGPIGIGGLIAGAFAIFQSIIFFRPTDNLKNIVSSEGNDIAELMQGIGELAGGLKVMVFLLATMAAVIFIVVASSL
jgi:hypothetical protein